MITVQLNDLECIAVMRALRLLLERDRDELLPHALAAYEGAADKVCVALYGDVTFGKGCIDENFELDLGDRDGDK